MKKIIFLLLPLLSFAQGNTEIFLFDISKKGDNWKVTNGKNISNNEGYDSQPHFYSKDLILFSSTRNKQTDIAAYSIANNKISYINNTPNGGEYSPQRIPKSENISAVRLDTDGKQRFYEYNFITGKDKELIKDLVVAYPLWYNKTTVVSSVIVNDSLELFVSDLEMKKNTSVTKNVGRSFHKIPKSKFISFMKKNGKNWEVWGLNPDTAIMKKIISVGKSQDICWLKDGTMLIASGSKILKFKPKKDTELTLFHDFSHLKFKTISRITTNKKSKKLAVTVEL